MICSNGKILYIFIFFCLKFDLCSSGCAHAEYEIDGECCPMCAPGNRVYQDCTEFTITECVPCTDSTFIDVPNGRTMCFNCMICAPGVGLRVKTACTRTSDTVCEPLEGFYCTHESRDSCIRAKKHTKCRPGEFILQMGTADRDAVCEKCGDGTFSNGSLQTCQPHSNCELMGMITVSVGTKTADSECSNPCSRLYSIIFTSGLLILSVALIIICTIRRRRTEDGQRFKSPSQCEQGYKSPPQCEQSDTSSPQCEQGYKSLPQCEQRDRSPPEYVQRNR